MNGGPLLDAAQVDALRDELYRVIADKDRDDVPQPVLLRNLRGDDAAPVWQIVNIWEASAPFKALMYSQKIVEEMAQLTGATELRIWHDQIQYKPAEIGARPAGIKTRPCGRLSAP